jgi:D-alanyl-D-alanine carboxypeptidase/D-alanyl-D-alanine-endopeptidase (penicillin-binding protein 4)
MAPATGEGVAVSVTRKIGHLFGVLVPPLLVAVAVVAGVTAFRMESEPDGPEARAEPAAAAATPVLSARRVPELLTTPLADRRLQAALGELMTRVPGDNCLTVEVEGRSIIADEPDRPLVPASVQKLVTATVGLHLLGLDFRYRTTVQAGAAPAGGVISGNLYLVGSGDPLLMTDDYVQSFRRPPPVSTDIEAFADAIVAAGVRQVAGSVVGDESRYDNLRGVPAWPARFAGQNVTGPLSALMFNDGYATFGVEPPLPATEDGAEPAPNEVAETPRQPAPDPALHAAVVLTGLLEARGVDVVGTPASGVAPAGGVEIAAIESPPFEEVLGEMLLESDNTTAELLIKEFGAQSGGGGTTAAGIEAANRALGELGLLAPGIQVADGSGLADTNLLSCAVVQAMLSGEGTSSVIGDSLPVAGETGTLTERFEGTAVEGRMRAKTGTLRQVTALAGYVDPPAGPTVTFSYLVNLPAGDLVSSADRDLQRQLGEIMVRYPEVPPESEVGPQSGP